MFGGEVSANMALFQICRDRPLMNGDFSLDALRTYVAELIATFFLVWVGTGAIIVNDATGGSITHPGVAASFGLIVMIMIYSFGSISGAHMNPAVSIGFFVIRQLSLIRLLGYLLAQICGALIASLSWRVALSFAWDTGRDAAQYGAQRGRSGSRQRVC